VSDMNVLVVGSINVTQWTTWFEVVQEIESNHAVNQSPQKFLQAQIEQRHNVTQELALTCTV